MQMPGIKALTCCNKGSRESRSFTEISSSEGIRRVSWSRMTSPALVFVAVFTDQKFTGTDIEKTCTMQSLPTGFFNHQRTDVIITFIIKEQVVGDNSR